MGLLLQSVRRQSAGRRLKRAQAARQRGPGAIIPFRVDDLVHRSPPMAGRSRLEGERRGRSLSPWRCLSRRQRRGGPSQNLPARRLRTTPPSRSRSCYCPCFFRMIVDRRMTPKRLPTFRLCSPQRRLSTRKITRAPNDRTAAFARFRVPVTVRRSAHFSQNRRSTPRGSGPPVTGV
jgi:hypothetical protein